MDGDQSADGEGEVSLAVRVWLPGLLLSIVRLLTSAWRASMAVVHPTEATLARRVVSPSDPIDPPRAWPQR